MSIVLDILVHYLFFLLQGGKNFGCRYGFALMGLLVKSIGHAMRLDFKIEFRSPSRILWMNRENDLEHAEVKHTGERRKERKTDRRLTILNTAYI